MAATSAQNALLRARGLGAFGAKGWFLAFVLTLFLREFGLLDNPRIIYFKKSSAGLLFNCSQAPRVAADRGKPTFWPEGGTGCTNHVS